MDTALFYSKRHAQYHNSRNVDDTESDGDSSDDEFNATIPVVDGAHSGLADVSESGNVCFCVHLDKSCLQY